MIENIAAGVANTNTTKQSVTAVNDQTQSVAKEPLKAEPSTVVSINGTPPDKPVTYEPTFGGIKKPPL